jgi:hypothetical protein
MQFMVGWKLLRRLLPALVLLTVASCRPATDAGIDVAPPLPATMLVLGPWQQGFGFLVDRGDRLVITGAQNVGKQADVVFPVIEDGKAKVRRDFYMKQPRIPAQTIYSDPNHDLAVIQLKSVPDGVPELKLAAAPPPTNSPVQTIVDPGSKSTLWATKSATVLNSGVEVFSEPGRRIETKVVEVSLDSKFAKSSGGAPIVNEAGELVGVITPYATIKPRVMGVDSKEVRSALIAAYRKLNTAAFEEKDYPKAVAYCDKALALDPDDALMHNERGAALSYMSRLDDAIKEYTEALRINPKLAVAYRNRGSAYYEQGKFDKAVDDCTQAIKIFDKYVSAYRKRQEAYLKLNQADLARRDKEIVDELTKRNWWNSEP